VAYHTGLTRFAQDMAKGLGKLLNRTFVLLRCNECQAHSVTLALLSGVKLLQHLIGCASLQCFKIAQYFKNAIFSNCWPQLSQKTNLAIGLAGRTGF